MNNIDSVYILTTTTANYDQGILNIPTRYSEFFGPHGSIVILELENQEPIESKIDRNNVKNHAPRTTSRLLKSYFQERGKMGHQYEVSVSKNNVKIKLLK